MVYPTMADVIPIPRGSGTDSQPVGGDKRFICPGFRYRPSTIVRGPGTSACLSAKITIAQYRSVIFDLVNDSNPDFTYKNQIFVDTTKQVKDGSNGFSLVQHPTNSEETKITFSQKAKARPVVGNQCARFDQCVSGVESRIASLGDIDYRRDLQRRRKIIFLIPSPNDRIYSVVEKPGYDGAPVYYDLEISTPSLAPPPRRPSVLREDRPDRLARVGITSTPTPSLRRGSTHGPVLPSQETCT